MNSYLNYLIEANLGLLLFYAIYLLLLKNENQFGFKRAYLLGSLIASLLFPLISIPNEGTQLIPSLSNLTTTHWLPEITIYANGPLAESTAAVQTSVWLWIVYAYLTGLGLFFVLFVVRVASLIALFHSAKKHFWRNYTVAESEKGHGSFSFFHFIFLGKASELNKQEKQEVLLHEEVHAQKIHSFDIVLVNILGIVFWFNPIVRFYRNSLVQVHEFEADARSVEGRDVNAYCNLLAKVALQSNGYTIANHFTNSLTLKRIAMMKTIKNKVQNWKVVVLLAIASFCLFVVACQDQVKNDQGISNNPKTLPQEVQDELKTLGKYYDDLIVTKIKQGESEKFASNSETIIMATLEGSYSIVGTRKPLKINESQVFDQVDNVATPIFGLNNYYKYIFHSIRYPEEARKKGIEGRVFLEFVIQTNGEMSDIRVLKGIDDAIDAEALRTLMQIDTKWRPAIHHGEIVKMKLVIPIVFKLNSSESQVEASTVNGPTLSEMVIVGYN